MGNGPKPERSGILVHRDNLAGKESHRTKYRDEKSRAYLQEIRPRYDAWHAANSALIGPGAEERAEDRAIVEQRVVLFAEYKDFLDAEKYATHFDSRSNLHSTVLEQFLFYLFRDIVSDFGDHALIGKSHAFKDLFFVPPGYKGMLDRPHAVIEKKDHDFVIGISVKVTLETRDPEDTVISSDEEDLDLDGSAEPEALPVEAYATDIVEDADQPNNRSTDYVLVRGDEEIHTIDVPAVAIECKTYLDKTMLEGSSRAAEDLKGRVPNSLYIVLMEWIKLSDAINAAKSKVDQIYVLRKQKNTDREFRYAETYVKNPIDPGVVWHLFRTVRMHLTADWKGGIQHGIRRGWLIDTPLDTEITPDGDRPA